MCLEPQIDDIQVAKEDTIFVEVPPDAVSTSADVKMHYAIIPSGPFTLSEGYQFDSQVVYIFYDGQCVTKIVEQSHSKGVNFSEAFQPRGSLSITKLSQWSKRLCKFPPCYMIAQHRQFPFTITLSHEPLPHHMNCTLVIVPCRSCGSTGLIGSC